MNNNRLFRNMNQKVIAGVASGLADYFGVDVAIIRVLLVLAIFIPLPLPVVIIYIAFWIAMPKSTSVANTAASTSQL
ncbi:PspC domain-containing protein [Telluribacter sp.]|jgi:phage shock protein PspC (stress-responsive transcriptional regulator)|uniref:PspC domain-containing protein n=1 Tax=Telluribacter sp. TaxID=1978767 RepID=UPI002E102E06|nr:PspC domain-containing protein [Telluribacter sp.]